MITYDRPFGEQWPVNVDAKGALWFMSVSHSFRHTSMRTREQMCMKQPTRDIRYPPESSRIKQ